MHPSPLIETAAVGLSRLPPPVEEVPPAADEWFLSHTQPAAAAVEAPAWKQEFLLVAENTFDLHYYGYEIYQN